MTIDNNTGTVITVDDAVSYTHTFQENNPDAIKSFFCWNKQSKSCFGAR